MNPKLPLIAATLMLGMAMPLGVPTAWAQDSQAVRDALNRAQSGAERRAVEDLINRLRGTATPAAPTPAVAAPAAATLPAANTPAGTPPATTVSAPGSLPTAAPATAATAPTIAAPATVPTPPAAAAPARPATAAAPVVVPMPRATAVPGAAATPSATAAPVAIPAAATAAARPAAGSAPVAPASAARGGDVMAKAPEIAEKMGLPTADIEVYFDFNSAAVTPQAMNTLVVMGKALSDPQLAGQRFIIGGHTDGKGRTDYNLNLSRRRAEAVRKFVIDHYKIEPSRLVARGYGKSRPKNTGMPLADENRRVQIINWTRMDATARAR